MSTSVHRYTGHINLEALGTDGTQELYLGCIVHNEKKRERVVLPLANVLKLTTRDVGSLRVVSISARAEFQNRVQAFCIDRKSTFRVVTRGGWEGPLFCFPNGDWIQCDRKSPIVRLPAAHEKFAAKFSGNGEIDAWRKIDAMSIGNTRMMLAIALSFAGPIVDWLRLDPPAVQLFDPRSGIGKSSIAAAAGSVWGGRDVGTFAESWNHTPGFFEILAATHHASLVVLDDVRTFQFKKHGFDGFDEVLMCFANGAGKGCLTDVGPIAEWRTPLLSTSNTTLDQMAARHNYPVDDALRMRLTDVPLPFGADGAFESLHGFDGHGAFGMRLRELAAMARGAASVLFISRVQTLRMRDEADVRRFVVQARNRYQRAARTRHSAGSRDLTRLIDRFSTIYAAGMLAIRTRVVTWTPEDLLEAVLACADAHLALGIPDPGTAPTYAPPASPLDRLREHVRANEHAFVDIRQGGIAADAEHDHDRCPGYLSELDSKQEYFFSDAMLCDVCGGRSAAGLVKITLRQCGMLNDTEARASTRRTVQVGQRRMQGIAVKTVFFSAPAGES